MKRKPNITVSIFLLMIDSFIAHFLPFFYVELERTARIHKLTAYPAGTISMMTVLIVTAFFWKVVVKRGKALCR
jgi:dolichyl-phosphate-mannose--protein O-mannosyl transferase